MIGLVALVVLAAVVGGAAGWLAGRGMTWAMRGTMLLGGSSAALLSVVAFTPADADRDLEARAPLRAPQEGFASSDTCRACHPGQYDTWHDSFHRTMTQLATPGAVAAAFDGRTLEGFGLSARVWREGDQFFADLGPTEGSTVDASVPLGPRRVVLLTGSHHMQAFWVTAQDGTLEQLPFVWIIDDARWIANDDSFLQPPGDEPAEPAIWSEGCVNCHATGGPWDPPRDGVHGDVAIVELGIACERCHGPADLHVQANGSPSRRYGLHLGTEGDATIINPRRLDHVESTDLCGTCHTVCEETVAGAGDFFPGAVLAEHLDFDAMWRVVDENADVVDPDTLDDDARDIVEAFWRDGRGRVAGREYDAVTQSACYLEGEMGCTSCHRVHGGDTDGQVAHDASGETLCGSCHAEIMADVGAHTRHEPGIGSDCLSCHMPYTSYGLISATRSHRVGSPAASGLEGRQTPNACNLCHLDQSVGWTARHLEAWYGLPTEPLPEDLADVPAGAVWMLRGDPVQRAIAAWHVGYGPTRETAELDPLLSPMGVLLADPYSAVRQIAGRVLAEHEGIELDMDALSAEPQLELMERHKTPRPGLDVDTMRRLFEERIEVSASIPE